MRPEINYKISENHAAEITAFKVGYVFGSPISFVQRASNDVSAKEMGDPKTYPTLKAVISAAWFSEIV